VHLIFSYLLLLIIIASLLRHLPSMMSYYSPKLTSLIAVLLLTTQLHALQHQRSLRYAPIIARGKVVLGLTTTAANNTEQPIELKPCYYKRVDGVWRPRKQLKELFIGQRLFAVRKPECDLLDGITGPKVFLECGVGRVKDKEGQNWKIVNGMLRLRRSGKIRMKESNLRKKLAKLPDDSMFAVYVSKINLEHASFEGKFL
jgi:hypothetical protein